MSKVIHDSLVNQTIYPPIDSLNKAREFVQLVQQYFSCESIGLLTDDDYKNQLFLFLEHEEIIVAARFNLASLDMQCLLDTIKPSLITYRHLQEQNISCNSLDSIESIKSLWAVCNGQSINLDSKGFIELLARIEKGELSTGRGANFSISTKNKVYMDSHGRCMFSGCGEHLGLDELTGIEGNYSYLAHNVASAENGPRGILFLSAELSDEPSNILLLCDKHHRLIDKIATCDYPAVKLTNMRKEFIALASSLLDGLSYQPIPVYVVLWPVNSNVVSVPELREISSSLSPLKLRCSGSTRFIHDSNNIFLKQSNLFIKNMPEIILDAANKVISQTKNDRQKAALFAFGPMPALIGLGASLGNKGGYIPMLMYRDGACWMWPSNNPTNEFYEILGLELLQKGCNDVVICINFTAVVPKLMAKADEISQKYNANIITINAKPEFIGNGAIGHPQDGITFSVELQKLLHKIKSDFGIQQVHLLVCASNAASVFIGLAYDLHHPKLVVYDFVEDGIEARLVINNDDNGTSLQTTT